MKAAEANVAVSGLSVASTLAPGFPVMLALRAEQWFRGALTGFSHDPLDPPNYAPDLVDRIFLVPYPTQGAAQLMSRIEHAHGRAKIDAIIPTLDSELPLYIELQPRLEKLGIGVVLPDARTLDLRSKIGIASLAPRLGLRAPFSRLARTYDEVFAVAREFLLPFVVKGHYYG